MVLSKGGQGGWWMVRARREGGKEGGKEGVAKYRSQSMTADNEI